MAKSNNGNEPTPLTIADMAEGLGSGTVEIRSKARRAYGVSSAEEELVTMLFKPPQPPATFAMNEEGQPVMLPNTTDPDYRAQVRGWSERYNAAVVAVSLRVPVKLESGEEVCYEPGMKSDAFKSWAHKAGRQVQEWLGTEDLEKVFKQVRKIGHAPGKVGEALGNSSTTPQPQAG